MKTKSDPRHQKRREVVKELFSYSFQQDQAFDPVSQSVIENLAFIDSEITAAAPEWPIERINKIDLAILRLAIFELLIQKTEPPKVIIDEAVELGKEFGSENSASFVNGVLGNILKKCFDKDDRN
ncbi:MAG: transcription antitermination factor NusB [Patescibacteria group bacterium]